MRPQLFALLWVALETIVPIAVAVAVVVAWRRGARAVVVAGSTVFVVVWSNFSFVPYLVGMKNLFPAYHYVSSDGGFKGCECFKSTACYWSVMQREWQAYSVAHPSAELLRNEPIRVWEFWNWYDYATHERWRLRFAKAGGED